ncbi:SOS response-associated peptidase [Mesorhizobium sp. M0152]|uniref:SOS response-associated peptidase family protein n=1 Tax=unclassified Mesorhizobium TaxID=325217 RepID=UPI00333D9820
MTADDDGNHKVRSGRWCLVPFWAKEIPKAAMFNARIEGADMTPAFRDPFKSKRCLIPADGGKDPWHIFQPGRAPFRSPAVGLHFESRYHKLHDHHAAVGGPVNQIHDGQPLMLDPVYYDAWLDQKAPGGDRRTILVTTLTGIWRSVALDAR